MMQVELVGVTKSFGSTIAIDDINLHVNESETVALLGPSGCGKTTTLRSISGLEEIDEGRISIADEVVASSEEGIHVPPFERNVGMMFQSNALWPHMTVYENISYPLKQKKDDDADTIDDKVTRLLDMVGLASFERQSVNNLSGGQQQRVALARSLVHDPDVLLMDEPLSSLDARLQRLMRAELRSLQQQQGFTTVYVTHDQEEAMYIADRIYLMNDGEIVESGSPEQIYREPEQEFSMEFFDPNDPITAEVSAIEADGSAAFRIVGAESDVVHTNHNGDFDVGDRVNLYIRPHDIEILDAGADGGENVVDARVVMTAFQGSGYEVGLEIGESTILCDYHDALQINDRLRAYLDPEKLQAFGSG